MATLDDFHQNVITQDTRKRQQCYEVLSRYLSDPRSSLACDDIDEFIGGLAAWVTCSNYKVSVNGLEILCLMIDRMGEEFKPHISTVLSGCIDRLGDSKEQVREQAQQLLLKLMMPASTPQYVFERMIGHFNHKLWHVREGVLICLRNTINRYGARCLQLSKIVPSICKLLEDPTPQVREAAVITLSEIYRHVGEKVRNDLSKKGLSKQRLNQVFAKFDEVKASGNMLATADFGPGRNDIGDDEPDFARPLSTKVPHAKRVSSSASSTGSVGSASGRKGLGFTRTTTSSARSSFRRKSSDAGASTGGVDEELFIKSFEDVPKVQIFSARDLTEQIQKCKDTLSDTNHTWEKRMEALRILRSIVVAGGIDYDDFLPLLRTLEPCLMNSIKDLRSQIVREGCITVAYYSQRLGSKYDHGAETLLPMLINLIPNSAKIMATSGIVCIRFILQYTHASRLIPIITNNMSSKASIIRRYNCEFLYQILHTWPTHILEKHIAIIQEAIKKGISDADSDARSFARNPTVLVESWLKDSTSIAEAPYLKGAFWGFADHFKDQADALLNNLDPAKQKALQGELSQSSSNNSLNSDRQAAASRVRARSASQDRGYESSTLGRMQKKGHTTRFRSARSDTGGDLDNDDFDGPHEDLETFNDRTTINGHRSMMRSSSAVDIAQGATSTTPRRRPSQSSLLTARMSSGSTQSLPRQKSIAPSSYSSGRISSTDHRTRPRMGTSQSQPSSRSSSPTPRHSYLTHTSGHMAPLTPSRPRKASTQPRSQGTSRESSPSRSVKSSGYGLPGRERRLSAGTGKSSTPKTSTHRTLKPGQDVEELLADALRQPIRKRYESYDSDDNASETSSVCSERSFSSYSKTSEASDVERWTPRRLSTPTAKDMGEILSLLQSSSYQDRKEGVISLQRLLRQNRFLSRIELKKATEIFTRMFHDPHSKVFSLFLEMLIDLIQMHNRDMADWLYILLSRLLNKMGTDILGSLQAKIQRTLDAARENFPPDLQFNILTRFMVDQTQSPTLKVKLAMLNYLIGLIPCMDPSDFSNSGDTRLVLSRIITWTNEPKNTDVRKSAQSVLIGLFNLNPPEFTMMLSGLPKTFQDGATKIVQHHMKAAIEPDVLTPRNPTSPQTPQNRSRPPSRGTAAYERDEADTENMNPEDIYNSIKKTSADIQNLSFNSKLDQFDDVKKRKEFTSQDSGIQDLRNDSPDAGESRKPQYNPISYQDDGTVNGYKRSALAEAMFDDENEMFFNEGNFDQEDMIIDILRELSNHNERHEERKNTMLQLIKLTRDGAFNLWDVHFKSILLILLETLGDDDLQVRSLALRVLREILRNQSRRFEGYAELTMLRILEAHKDPAKEVVRAAEECAATLASYIPPLQSIKILVPIIQTAQFPINLAAIKMQTKVIEQLPSSELTGILHDVIPGLLKGYDDRESSVRKGSVFCLVAIYMSVGEGMRPYLTDLNGSKVKLLNLYIKRAQAQKESGKVLSPHGSDTS